MTSCSRLALLHWSDIWEFGQVRPGPIKEALGIAAAGFSSQNALSFTQPTASSTEGMYKASESSD